MDALQSWAAPLVRKAEDGRREPARLAGSEAASKVRRESIGGVAAGGVAVSVVAGNGVAVGDVGSSATALLISTATSSRGEGGGAGELTTSW